MWNVIFFHGLLEVANAILELKIWEKNEIIRMSKPAESGVPGVP